MTADYLQGRLGAKTIGKSTPNFQSDGIYSTTKPLFAFVFMRSTLYSLQSSLQSLIICEHLNSQYDFDELDASFFLSVHSFSKASKSVSFLKRCSFQFPPLKNVVSHMTPDFPLVIKKVNSTLFYYKLCTFLCL